MNESRADDIARYGYTQELHRSLGFVDLLVYGLIFMVPIAPFGIFGSVFQGSGGMVALAYAIGMVAMMFTALSYSQMSRAFPMAGSVYTYAGRGISPPVGFLAGWMILLDYVLVPALLYLIAAIAMNSLVSGIPVWLWLVGFVVLNTVVNYMGIEMTARVNKVMLAAELVVLAIFLVIGIVALTQGKGRGFDLSPLYDSGTFSWSLVFGAVSIAVLSFLGFDGISTLAEENKESAEAIGRAMVAALLLAGVLFIVQTWVASLLVTDPEALVAKGDPGGTAFYDAAAVAGGPWLSKLTALATAIAWGFANSLVAQAATSRLLYAMARDRQLPSFLARVHKRKGVPVNATLLVAVVSLVLGLYFSTRDDGISPAQHIGELRRPHGVPGAACVGGRALPRPWRQPGLVAPPDRAGDRVRDPRLRAPQRPAPGQVAGPDLVRGGTGGTRRPGRPRPAARAGPRRGGGPVTEAPHPGPAHALSPHASASRATSSAQPQERVTPAPPWP
jgi:amino acid transporter